MATTYKKNQIEDYISDSTQSALNDKADALNNAVTNADNNFSTNQTFGQNLTVTGDLTVNGTTTTVNTAELLVEDNLITVNNGEVGAGVTAGSAGIEVDRGTATNYEFKFVEVTDSFRIGEAGSLQAVLTREDTPIDNGVTVFDTATQKVITSANLTFDGNNLSIGAGNISNTGNITGKILSAVGGNVNIDNGFFLTGKNNAGDGIVPIVTVNASDEMSFGVGGFNAVFAGNITTSGRYLASSDGTAGSPGFGVVGTGSGMYFDGNDVLVSSGSQEQLRISTTGIGIGGSGTAKVTVIKDGAYNSEGTNGIKIQDLPTSQTVSLNIGVDSTNNIAFIQAMEPLVSFSTKPLILQGNGGRLGVGVISPRAGYKVDIFESTDNGLNIQAGNASSDIALAVGSASTADKFKILSGGAVLINSGGYSPPSQQGEGTITSNTVNGLMLSGEGSVNDLALLNSNGEGVLVVATGTRNTTFAKDISVLGKVNLGTDVEYTISGGAITPTNSNIKVETEGLAATDNLDTISGGNIGDIIYLRPTSAVRDIVVRHGVGNIFLNGGVNFTMDNAQDSLTLRVNSNGVWMECGRSKI